MSRQMYVSRRSRSKKVEEESQNLQDDIGMLQNTTRRPNMKKIEKEKKQGEEFVMAELLWTIRDLEEIAMLEQPKKPKSKNKRKEGKRQGHH